MNDSITQVQTQEFSARCQKVLQVARQLYHGRPDWVTFFRETLGVNGAARSVFMDQDEYVLFEQSSEFADIQMMVANLRTKKAGGSSKSEVTRVITVRLPESLHEALKAEAADHHTSMNKLCITKLLQVLAEEEEASAAAANAAAENPQVGMPVRQGLPTPAPAPPQPVRTTQDAPQSPSFRSTYPGQ